MHLLTVTLSHGGGRGGGEGTAGTVVWPTPPAHTAPPLLWGPNYRLRETPAGIGGGFSAQGLVWEERGKLGKLQNSRGPASKGKSATSLEWGPGWELSLGERKASTIGGPYCVWP